MEINPEAGFKKVKGGGKREKAGGGGGVMR